MVNVTGVVKVWFKRCSGLLLIAATAWLLLTPACKKDTAHTDNKIADTVYVFLTIGQSNAQGRGTDSLAPKVPDGVLQYYHGAIAPANDPVGSANTGSAWPAFGIKYQQLTGHNVLFVSGAKSGSAMCVQANDGIHGDWSVTGALRYAARDTLAAALKKLIAIGYTPIFAGINFSQGEQDAQVIGEWKESATQYHDGLVDLIAFFRNIYPHIPFYIYRTGRKVNGTEQFHYVRNQQESVAAADVFTEIVYRDAYNFKEKGWLQADNIHYTQAGYNDMGTTGAINVVQFEEGLKTR